MNLGLSPQALAGVVGEHPDQGVAWPGTAALASTMHVAGKVAQQ